MKSVLRVAAVLTVVSMFGWVEAAARDGGPGDGPGEDIDPPAEGGGTPPEPVYDLEALATGIHSIDLTWTAPGDEGGSVAGYDIRFSLDPIDPSNWIQATPLDGEPAPKSPHSSQRMAVLGLAPSTTYYFALRSYDADGNESPLSNVAIATTDEEEPPPEEDPPPDEDDVPPPPFSPESDAGGTGCAGSAATLPPVGGLVVSAWLAVFGRFRRRAMARS